MQAKEPENKINSGRWHKGQSGNPGGRPKAAQEESIECQKLNPRTRAVLIELLDSPDDELRLKAACRLRDEANGKPTQSVHLEREESADIEQHLMSKSDAELLAIATGIAVEQSLRTPEVES